MKHFLIPPLPFLAALLLSLALSGCGAKPIALETKLRKAAFQMPKKPASCTKQAAYPSIVRNCRLKVCKGLPKAHCQNGMDDVAAAQWISCTKEELLVNGANADDCRLFVYDLEAAMNSGADS